MIKINAGIAKELYRIEIKSPSGNTKTKTSINRKLGFIGNLTEEQRTRLIAVANACPVHKILTNPVIISTSEANF